MVQGAEEQDHVVRVVGRVQVAGVTQFDAATGVPGLGDVALNGVHEVHAVAVLREPSCMGSGTTTDVQHGCRGGREMAAQEFLGPDHFQYTVGRDGEPVGLVDGGGVELDDSRRDLVGRHETVLFR